MGGAILAGVLARFNALPFKAIAVASAIAMVGLALFAAYREGRHAADEAAAVGLAKHNAGIAAKYMRDAKAAEDAAARERVRADDLAKQVTSLKEEVAHVAIRTVAPKARRQKYGRRRADKNMAGGAPTKRWPKACRCAQRKIRSE